jgi:nitrite reductase (NADH) large subunit
MIICQCNAVSEKEIIKTIKKKGAVKLEHIQRLTGAGTSCGRCIPLIDDLLEKHRTDDKDPQLKLDL